MKTRELILVATVCVCAATMISCSSPRDAAIVGAAIGRQIGTPLGTMAVVVDETFKSAGDVVDANPRYDNQRKSDARSRDVTSVGTGSQYGDANDAHYYRAEVLVKTHGPADIESIAFQESEDVTEFWQ